MQSKQIYLENTSNRMGILKVIFVSVIGEHVDKPRKEKKPKNKPPEFPRKGSASVETVSFTMYTKKTVTHRRNPSQKNKLEFYSYLLLVS